MFKAGCFKSLFHPSNMANIVCVCERERRKGERGREGEKEEEERERSNKRMREIWNLRNGED